MAFMLSRLDGVFSLDFLLDIFIDFRILLESMFLLAFSVVLALLFDPFEAVLGMMCMLEFVYFFTG